MACPPFNYSLDYFSGCTYIASISKFLADIGLMNNKKLNRDLHSSLKSRCLYNQFVSGHQKKSRSFFKTIQMAIELTLACGAYIAKGKSIVITKLNTWCYSILLYTISDIKHIFFGEFFINIYLKYQIIMEMSSVLKKKKKWKYTYPTPIRDEFFFSIREWYSRVDI